LIIITDTVEFQHQGNVSSNGDRKLRVLQLIRDLKNRYDMPVLALHGYGDLEFGEKIAEADFSVKYPWYRNGLNKTAQDLIDWAIDQKKRDKRTMKGGPPKASLLVVDDDLTVSRIISDFLLLKNFAVQTAASAEEALEICAKGDIEIVITGVVMPGMDGFELTQIIKEKHNCDVIMMTDSKEALSREKANLIGASELFYLPLRFSQLHKSVEEIRMRRGVEDFKQKFGPFENEEKQADEKKFSQTGFFPPGASTMAAIIPEKEALDLLEKLESLQNEIGGLPDELEEGGPYDSHNPAMFDANGFFAVFDKLHLMEGCTLEYYYHRFSDWEYPCVYTRKKEAPPIKSYREFKEAFPSNHGHISHVAVEPSPSGYFQYAVFDYAVRQFYLYWHAFSGLASPVMTGKQLNEILDSIGGDLEQEELTKALTVNPLPVVWMHGDFARVRLVMFSAHVGLYYRNISIRPNIVENSENETILNYDCGITF